MVTGIRDLCLQQKENASMSEKKNKTVCPDCNGKKEIKGNCVCDAEWRGSQVGDEWEDCHCTPTIPCPTCSGTGYVETE
jgi:hypothetical protein